MSTFIALMILKQFLKNIHIYFSNLIQFPQRCQTRHLQDIFDKTHFQEFLPFLLNSCPTSKIPMQTCLAYYGCMNEILQETAAMPSTCHKHRRTISICWKKARSDKSLISAFLKDSSSHAISMASVFRFKLTLKQDKWNYLPCWQHNVRTTHICYQNCDVPLFLKQLSKLITASAVSLVQNSFHIQKDEVQ